MGVLGLVSSKDFANSTVLASIYLAPSFSSINAAIAYVILSGLRALSMHRRCIAVLFFHSWGNFSRSGHSHSTNFFQRLAELSMSRSKFLRTSGTSEWLKRQRDNSFSLCVPKLFPRSETSYATPTAVGEEIDRRGDVWRYRESQEEVQLASRDFVSYQ